MSIRTQKDSRVTETYDQIQRTLGQEVVRQVHRLGHAVVGEISLAPEKKEIKTRTYASKYGCANASSTVARFLGSNV